MGFGYTAKRTRNLFDPRAKEPFRLSRTKIDLFVECPRCFYLDRRLGVGRPPTPPFSLNSAVDTLLKKEFDLHRAKGTAHPLMKAYQVDAVPLRHAKMDEWRDSLKFGVQFYHQPTNFLVTGGIDDVWVNPEGEFIVVDYKATAKDREVGIDAEWQQSYKRQLEVYQWLFRKNGFPVSDTGYFVYCNGQTDRAAFDGKLEFKITLHAYRGDDSWVEQKIVEAYRCLRSDTLPKSGDSCDYCAYRAAAASVGNSS